MDVNSKTYKFLAAIASIPIIVFGGFLYEGIYTVNLTYILISLIFLSIGLGYAGILYLLYWKGKEN